jgi:FkbM family methyltransferase
MNIEDALKRNSITTKGIIHVGAHTGQELEMYTSMTQDHIIYFEPQPDIYKTLADRASKHQNVICENVALGSKDGEQMMWISDNGGLSSSLLKPSGHMKIYPDCHFPSTISVPVTTLDNYFIKSDLHPKNFNFLNIDVQGYELEVLKGCTSLLQYIDAIMCEVNGKTLYRDCALVHDIDEFCNNYGFIRKETMWVWGDLWGDAFYKKCSL